MKYNDLASLSILQVLPDAGHHIYADQWKMFNNEVNKACEWSDRNPTTTSGEEK